MESSLFTKYDSDNNRNMYYYNKFKYRCSLRLKGIHMLRSVKFNAARISGYLGYPTYVSGRKTTWKETVGDNLKLFEQICNWIAAHKTSEHADKLKITASHNCMNLYYNDEAPIEDFLRVVQEHTNANAVNKYRISFTRSSRVENFERGVLYLRRPKYKYRLYFNYTKLGVDDAAYVRKYLLDIEKSHQAYNRSLHRFAHRANFQGQGWDIIYLNSYLDVNDDVHATYLNLFKPGIIYRVAKIEQRINSVESEECSG